MGLPAEIESKYLLLDGDVLVYRCCWAAHPKGKDGEEQVDHGFEYLRGFIDFSIGGFTRSGKNFTGEVWLSGDSNFREALSKSKPYKGNRKDRAKPRYFKEAREYLIKQYGAKVTDGVEADDELGCGLTRDPKGSCILTNDSDLLQVSGWHYDWTKYNLQWVSRKAGDFNLYTKILSGDPGDNIPGIPGFGEITAAKVLKGSQSSRELCQRTWDVYRNHSNTGLERAREYFLEQANLVYVLRRSTDRFQVPITLE